MSPRNSKSAKKNQGPGPTPDVYVALLFVSVAALTFGCILLYLELESYGWQLPGAG